MAMPLCLENDQLEIVKRILKVHFGGLEVDAYGPRVTGVDLTPDAELNVVVISSKPISFEEMVGVENAFTESKLPFRVDVVDWIKLPENMQKEIKKEHVVIQEADEDN
ncbi:MAG: nucleotidyltransferase domain-containing protein [Fibrobacteraceae bacterium]